MPHSPADAETSFPKKLRGASKIITQKSGRSLLIAGFLLLTFCSEEKKAPPSPHPKIISLTPALTSLLVDLGQKEHIIAVTSQDPFHGSQSLGSFIRFSLEKILILKPDFVFYQDFQRTWISSILHFSSIHFIEIPISDLASIFEAARKMARILKVSQDFIREKESYLNQLKKNPPFHSAFTYIAVIDRDQDFKRVFVAGEKSYISQLLSYLGGKNLLDVSRDYVGISEEFFLKESAVDFILDFSLNRKPVSQIGKTPVISFFDSRLTIPDLRLEEKIHLIQTKIQSFFSP